MCTRGMCLQSLKKIDCKNNLCIHYVTLHRQVQNIYKRKRKINQNQIKRSNTNFIFLITIRKFQPPAAPLIFSQQLKLPEQN